VDVDDPIQRHRVTVTPPVINNASRVMFLVAGASKAQAVWNILKGPRDIDKFPAQVVAPEHGELIWLLDKAAASLIG
jgi:6-phosphogluconolactonase